MAGTVYPINFPILDIDLSTSTGRKECYDNFCLYRLKVDLFFHISSTFILKLFGNKIDQAKKRMLIINSTTSTYKLLRELFLGAKWEENMDFVAANNQLNQ